MLDKKHFFRVDFTYSCDFDIGIANWIVNSFLESHSFSSDALFSLKMLTSVTRKMNWFIMNL